MAFLPLPWAHEAPGSNPGAPTTSSLNYLTFLLRRFLTSFRLWHTEERLRSDQVHTGRKSREDLAATRSLPK